MPFYGPADRIYVEEIYEHLIAIQNIYNRCQLPNYMGDNMTAFGRNLSFTQDAVFMSAMQNNAHDNVDSEKIWRLHIYCWAAGNALNVPGDFVELGVYKGLYSGVLAEYLDFGRQAREFYLYDSFAGLVEDWSEERERKANNHDYDWDGTHDAVLRRFSAYPNIHVIRGIVPEVLLERAPQRIAFLHLDLNAAKAERAAIEYLAPRLSEGAVVLMDDFGRYEHRGLCAALREFWQLLDLPILELPTGQGMVIYRSPRLPQDPE